MKRSVIYPYLRPSPTHIQPNDWIVEDSISEPSGIFLPYWDYNTPVKAQREIFINLEGIYNDCNLPVTDSLMLLAVWHSQGTTLRGVANSINFPANTSTQNVSLQVGIKGELLAASVVIKTQLVLAKHICSQSRLVPKLPGTILWEDQISVRLEGSSTRFPVDIINFDTTSWTSSDAAWYLDWYSQDLQQAALGNLILYVNSNHVRVSKAVASVHSPDPEDRAILSAMYFDVGRTLIRGAIQNEDFIQDPSTYEQGSLGRVIRNLIEVQLPSYTPRTLRDMEKERPSEFESLLQHGLRLFQY